MKNLVSAGIAVALLSTAFNATAGPELDRKISIVGIDFLYDPNATYNEIGTESSIPLVDTDNDGFDDFDNTKSMTFATLRDYNPATGGGLNDSKLPDGSPGSDGKGDGTFGDLNYADPVSSLTLFQRTDTTDPTSPFGDQIAFYDTQPLAVDFRIVLETAITGEGDFGIIEEYSFFDILSQDGASDWGLALDSLDTDDAFVSVSETAVGSFEFTLIFTGIAGEVFDNSPITNNLPFGAVDPDEPITFGFTFQEQEIFDWSQIVTGSGDGNVVYTAVVPEPASLGLIGLTLAGMGLLQRRRKTKLQK